ncbi:MAG: hypothetical protein WCG27_12455 [Pseudomonadota bacterium]
MGKGEILVDKSLVVKQDRYVAKIKVYQVAKSKIFPFGIKAKFLLHDLINDCARLLVDNHEPFGFHMHTKLPDNPTERMKLEVEDYNEALQIFFNEVERILKNEE